jgi:hypothetical protein
MRDIGSWRCQKISLRPDDRPANGCHRNARNVRTCERLFGHRNALVERVSANLRQGALAWSRDSLSRRGLGAFLSSRNKRQVQGVTALMIETSAMLFRKLTALTIMAAAAVALSSASANADQPYTHQDLKSPSEFMSISSPAERSRAIFNEIGKLLTHPRCMNCHPAGDHPLQGADQHEHMPPVWRSDTGHLATNCFGCHTEKNMTLHEAASYKSIPGHPRWGVAPLSMAWERKTLGEICRQLKDVNLNGGRDLALLQEHVAKDDLVAWGWNPGEGREPAPGNQKTAGQLVQAWIDNGAECPP